MNEAPERIYSGPSVDDKGVFWDVGHWDKEPDEGCIEYVRADRIEELEEKLAKAVSRLDKLTYWLDIDQELWDAFTVMEKSDHRHMQSEVQAIKDILTGDKDE